jgi:hypothetical protein
MSRLIKKPSTPRRDFMSDFRRELLMIERRRQSSSVSLFSCPLKKSVAAIRNLAEASLADLAMIVLLVSLLVTILLLTWIIL